MGLDGVELIMEVEDEFGITIPDSDAAEMRTVGDLVTLCFDRIHATKTMRCPSMPCFLSLRRLVREVRNDPELKLRPGDVVEDLLKVTERKRLWRRLPELLDSAPRELRRPPWFRKTLVVVVLAFPVALLVVCPWRAEFMLLIWMATFGFGILLNLLTLRFRTRTPSGYDTLGDITKRMVGLQIATNPPDRDDYESVFAIVKQLVVDQLGVEYDEVVPGARFVEDLGVG